MKKEAVQIEIVRKEIGVLAFMYRMLQFLFMKRKVEMYG
jgi:hypothetical protein